MASRRTLVGGGALALAAALIGAGAYAQFTDTETTNADIDSGQLDIVGAADIGVTDMAPGDIAFRSIGVTIPTNANDTDLVASIEVSANVLSDVIGAPTDNG